MIITSGLAAECRAGVNSKWVALGGFFVVDNAFDHGVDKDFK